MTYMKPQSKFLANSLDEAFADSLEKTASHQDCLEAYAADGDPVVSAMTEMDKAAEILEGLGLTKAATKVVKVMDKVSKKMKKKMDEKASAKKDKDVA